MEIQQNIKVAVDIVVFTILSQELHVLCVQRSTLPYHTMRALPGGFAYDSESCNDAAYRKLWEETGVGKLYLEQLYTFSEPKRDPRGRVISISYIALMENMQDLTSSSSTSQSQFFSLKKIPDLAFDHFDIIKYAYQRLKRKLEYTNIAQYFLPKYFTLSQFQRIYEIIIGHRFDVRNFRKKIKSIHIIKETNEFQKDVGHRPAKLYEFIHKDIQIAEIRSIF